MTASQEWIEWHSVPSACQRHMLTLNLLPLFSLFWDLISFVCKMAPEPTSQGRWGISWHTVYQKPPRNACGNVGLGTTPLLSASSTSKTTMPVYINTHWQLSSQERSLTWGKRKFRKALLIPSYPVLPFPVLEDFQYSTISGNSRKWACVGA